MEDRIVDFVAGLRGAGVRVSVAESVDCLSAVDHTGVRDRRRSGGAARHPHQGRKRPHQVRAPLPALFRHGGEAASSTLGRPDAGRDGNASAGAGVPRPRASGFPASASRRPSARPGESRSPGRCVETSVGPDPVRAALGRAADDADPGPGRSDGGLGAAPRSPRRDGDGRGGVREGPRDVRDQPGGPGRAGPTSRGRERRAPDG